jgi:hypothetical protein
MVLLPALNTTVRNIKSTSEATNTEKAVNKNPLPQNAKYY